MVPYDVRNLKDVGCSVSAWGYWGDFLNGPYQAWGITCEDPSFFAASNKQFNRTAVDIAEHNIKVSDANIRFLGDPKSDNIIDIHASVKRMHGIIASDLE